MTTGSLRAASYDGDYWAKVAFTSSLYAYYLDFGSGNVNPSYDYHRWYGFTVQTTQAKSLSQKFGSRQNLALIGIISPQPYGSLR